MKNLLITTNLKYDTNSYNFDENFKCINNSDSFIYTCFNQLDYTFDKKDFFNIIDSRYNLIMNHTKNV